MSHRFKTPSQAALEYLVAVSSAPTLAAGNPAATVDLLGRCVACHGVDGIGKAPQYPNLRGQKAAYI